MENGLRLKQQNISTVTVLFIAMLLFRFFMDFGYWQFLAGSGDMYGDLSFSPVKWAVSLLWCVVLFFGIRHNEKKASTFFLYLVYLTQIIPISTIYALYDDSSAYYHTLCAAFLICELIVGWTANQPILKRNSFISTVLHWGLACAIPVVLLAIFLQNGLPSLTALDISKVYELRGSGQFQLSKYMEYLMRWATAFFIPLFIAKAISERRYFIVLFLCGIQSLIYLYTGHKSFLFALPLVIVCAFWSRREKFYQELFLCFCIGYVILVMLPIFAPAVRSFSETIHDVMVRSYSYLCRRTLFDPAINKFRYYDYFSTRPMMGLGGVFPRWLIPIDNPYADVAYTFEISAIYYNAPDMNSNTGFLAEGYMRFGHVGTFLILILFAWILKLIDGLQDRIGYGITVSILVYPIFGLADAHLFDELFFGRWLPIMLVLIFCQYSAKRQKENSVGYQNHLPNPV